MRGNKCAPIFFSLSTKQKIEFCFSLTKPKQTKRKKRRKNLTPKKCWTSILRKESQVVNRVFRNESVVFQQESLQFKVSFFNKKAYSLSLTKLSQKIFSSLFVPKRKSNANSTTRLCVIHKERSLKIRRITLFFLVTN